MSTNQVVVAPLDVALEGTGKGLLSRVSRVFVHGTSPGPALQGIAEVRASANPPAVGARECEDSMEFAFYTSPEKASARSDVRVIATLEEDPGPVVIVGSTLDVAS